MYFSIDLLNLKFFIPMIHERYIYIFEAIIMLIHISGVYCKQNFLKWFKEAKKVFIFRFFKYIKIEG